MPRIVPLSSLASIVLLFLLLTPTHQAAAAPPVAKKEIIVVLKDGSNLTAVLQRHRQRYNIEVTYKYEDALTGYAAIVEETKVAQIAQDQAVLFIHAFTAPHRIPRPRMRVIPPSAAARGTDLPPQPEQYIAAEIERMGGTKSSARSGDGRGRIDLNVAVLDSGIDPSHPDLRVAGGHNCLGGDERDWIDHGDFHGTGVAGLIAALDNDIGMVGIAPGAKLWSVRVADPFGDVPEAAFLCGLDWVASTKRDLNPFNDIAVVNMSLSGTDNPEDDHVCGRRSHDAFHLAICKIVSLGVVLVAAAGNDAADLGAYTPASYSEVLTVAGMVDFDGKPGARSTPPEVCFPTDKDDEYAVFSNFATRIEDSIHMVAAPSVCVYSTVPGGLYGVGDGTSFAAPLVTGTVLLCISSGACRGLTPEQIVHKIVLDARVYNTIHRDNGFLGDPYHPVGNRHYGFLPYAGMY